MDISTEKNVVLVAGHISILDISEIISKVELLSKERIHKKINVLLADSATMKESTSIILSDSLKNIKNKLGDISLNFEVKDFIRTNQSPTQKKLSKVDKFLVDLGERSIEFKNESQKTLTFVKSFIIEIKKDFTTPSNFRFKELVSQIDQTGIFAIGIVSLVTFLIGIVIAYLMGNQLRYYGANIFVVDGVAVAMCRELSPILVAIVVAGRSGSAFAAELGSMKLNHETDALEVMGLKPFQILVIPRIVGLMISLPFLVLIGDMFGILGGMFISNIHLDITYSNFIERLHLALRPKQVFVGLMKAPVFALFIAAIGCRLGLDAEPNAVSIGRNTTKTVVHSIVSVILLNAAFAIFFTQIGI
jgi:phospholipid/cholesterol/gamma-HCH transport system permease protein